MPRLCAGPKAGGGREASPAALGRARPPDREGTSVCAELSSLCCFVRAALRHEHCPGTMQDAPGPLCAPVPRDPSKLCTDAGLTAHHVHDPVALAALPPSAPGRGPLRGPPPALAAPACSVVSGPPCGTLEIRADPKPGPVPRPPHPSPGALGVPLPPRRRARPTPLPASRLLPDPQASPPVRR